MQRLSAGLLAALAAAASMVAGDVHGPVVRDLAVAAAASAAGLAAYAASPAKMTARQVQAGFDTAAPGYANDGMFFTQITAGLIGRAGITAGTGYSTPAAAPAS